MSGERATSRPRAIGVKFSEDTLVPVVVLKAVGEQAEGVIDRAKEMGGVPIVRAPELASKLYRVPIDQSVTPDLFPLMAALLAHVIQVDQNRKEGAATS